MAQKLEKLENANVLQGVNSIKVQQILFNCWSDSLYLNPKEYAKYQSPSLYILR